MENEIPSGSRRSRGGARNTPPPISENFSTGGEPQGEFRDVEGTIENPILAPTVDRDYSKPEIDHTLTEDIPEPDFQPIVLDDIPTAGGSGGGNNGGGNGGDDKASGGGNPDLLDAEMKDKKLAAKMAVQEFLDKYALLHKLGAHIAKFPENKLQDMYVKDELRPDLVLPTPQGNATVAEIVESYNATCDDTIKYDPAFGEKVRAPMERIFVKRGIGITDEQFVALAFAEDLGVKAVTIFSMRSSINSTLKSISIGYQAQLKQMGQQQNTPPPPPPPNGNKQAKSKQPSAAEEAFPSGKEPEETVIDTTYEEVGK